MKFPLPDVGVCTNVRNRFNISDTEVMEPFRLFIPFTAPPMFLPILSDCSAAFVSPLTILSILGINGTSASFMPLNDVLKVFAVSSDFSCMLSSFLSTFSMSFRSPSGITSTLPIVVFSPAIMYVC